MALDPAFVGREYPRCAVYEVSREKIREFARAIGDDDPVRTDPEAAKAAGYRDLVAPPTFTTIINLTAINAIVTDPALGLDYGRMVHGDQSFTYHRPVVAGDELVADSTIEAISHRAGNDFITLRADIHDADGNPVVVARAQLVVRDAEEEA
ncbi:MaoC family dehydratase N-terminal domain-containing protein [Actinokineospora soli]